MNLREINLKNLGPIAVLLLVLGCGGGTSLTGSGSAGLGSPGPEDVFDLPNTLPDDFVLTSCPPLSGYESREDLGVTISSPDAPAFDFDGDGDDDSWVTQFNGATLRTFILEAHALGVTALPPPVVDLTVQPRVIGGRIFDETGTPTNENSYGDDLFTDLHWVAPYRHPILRYTIFSGIEFFMNPGVHVFTVYFADLNAITHCASQSYRIIMCPQDGDPVSPFLDQACPPS